MTIEILKLILEIRKIIFKLKIRNILFLKDFTMVRTRRRRPGLILNPHPQPHCDICVGNLLRMFVNILILLIIY